MQNSDISPNLDQGKQLSRGPFPCRINIYIFLFKLSLEGLTARRRSRLARLGTPRRPCRLEAGPRDVAEGPSIRPADPALGDKAQISHLRSRAFPHHHPYTPKSAWGANCSQIWGLFFLIFFFPPYKQQGKISWILTIPVQPAGESPAASQPRGLTLHSQASSCIPGAGSPLPLAPCCLVAGAGRSYRSRPGW